MEVYMTKQLPERANLEHLRTQAKALLPTLDSGQKLADAQRMLAREYGFASWTKLKNFVEGREERVTTFFNSIRGGDRETASRLISLDPALANAHSPVDFEAPPLNLAAGRDDLPMIELLLQHGADVNGKSTWWAGGFGALDFCDLRTAQLLMKHGARLTAHAASRLGLGERLKALIDQNPDVVYERGGDGQFPLHFAGSAQIVDILLDAGAELEARDLDHESTAAQWRIQDCEVLRRLVERGCETDVYMAIMLDDEALVRSKVREDPSCLGRISTDPQNGLVKSAPGEPIYTYNIGAVRPFQLAIHSGKAAALSVLRELSPRKDLLLEAIWAGDASAVAQNRVPLADLTSEDLKLLPAAAWERRIDSLRLMLELGFPVDTVGVHHSSALDRAAFHGFDDIIELLLTRGPSLSIKNEFGGTPLGACIYGSIHSWRKDGDFPRSVELLLAAGSTVPELAGGSPEVQAVLRRAGAR
jgi:ankyrin repeat protein